MKQTLLIVFFSFFTFAAFSHDGVKSSEALPIPPSSIFDDQNPISIYPNPATHFISIDSDENVKEISVFNLVGRKLLSFKDVKKEERYDVTSLPSGMYLVRIVDQSNKIITTQRISKR
jgi:hypothetical protein